jgi:hypothetical protein
MLVIDGGARQDFVDYDLGRALNFPNAEMVEMFCAHGARANAGHLHQAVWRRRPPRTVTTLLDAGAPMDAAAENRLTPLRIAVRWGDADVAALLIERGADEANVTDVDRTIGRWLSGGASDPIPPTERAALDRMLLVSVEGGHLDAMRRLLDAGASIDGKPDLDGVPLGQACWRGRVEMVRELVGRGAALRFHHGGTAMGAALHGSQNCHHPEGGPSMRPIDEIPKAPYAEIVRLLVAAGAPSPERVGADGPPAAAVMAELGINEAET